MGQARTEVIPLMIHKHLRLILQAPEGGRMHDAIAIPLKCQAKGMFLLKISSST
jgi:hypothetical protein